MYSGVVGIDNNQYSLFKDNFTATPVTMFSPKVGTCKTSVNIRLLTHLPIGINCVYACRRIPTRENAGNC
jgi:hypothetical protein